MLLLVQDDVRTNHRAHKEQRKKAIVQQKVERAE